MLSLFAPSTAAFSAPTVHVAQQPAVRSSPVQMAEMPSRRAALLSAAALVVPLAAQAKPEDYVGGCKGLRSNSRTLHLLQPSFS